MVLFVKVFGGHLSLPEYPCASELRGGGVPKTRVRPTMLEDLKLRGPYSSLVGFRVKSLRLTGNIGVSR